MASAPLSVVLVKSLGTAAVLSFAGVSAWIRRDAADAKEHAVLFGVLGSGTLAAWFL
jgi:hypothetical protein